MANFSYKGRDKTGELVSGEREGNSRDQVAATMMEDGIIPVEITELKQSSDLNFDLSQIKLFKNT